MWNVAGLNQEFYQLQIPNYNQDPDNPEDYIKFLPIHHRADFLRDECLVMQITDKVEDQSENEKAMFEYCGLSNKSDLKYCYDYEIYLEIKNREYLYYSDNPLFDNLPILKINHLKLPELAKEKLFIRFISISKNDQVSFYRMGFNGKGYPKAESLGELYQRTMNNISDFIARDKSLVNLLYMNSKENCEYRLHKAFRYNDGNEEMFNHNFENIVKLPTFESGRKEEAIFTHYAVPYDCGPCLVIDYQPQTKLEPVSSEHVDQKKTFSDYKASVYQMPIPRGVFSINENYSGGINEYLEGTEKGEDKSRLLNFLNSITINGNKLNFEKHYRKNIFKSNMLSKEIKPDHVLIDFDNRIIAICETKIDKNNKPNKATQFKYNTMLGQLWTPYRCLKSDPMAELNYEGKNIIKELSIKKNYTIIPVAIASSFEKSEIMPIEKPQRDEFNCILLMPELIGIHLTDAK